MNRRRLIVFAVIILVGVLVGFFCLPNSSNTNGVPGSTARGSGDEGKTIAEPRGRTLPIAEIGKTPAARAKRLVDEARLSTDVARKGKLLQEAYTLNKDGQWGGEAAAEIGLMWKQAGHRENARKWYLTARRVALSPDTLKRVNAELLGMQQPPKVTAASLKMLTYKVQPNDSLWKIAKRYAVTIGAIKAANNLRSHVIRAGSTLRVPKGPFDVAVSKTHHTLQLLQEGKVVKQYRVGLGKDDRTPVGSWAVQNKLEKPVWYSDQGPIPYGDPRNVLGSRWIGFDGRLGIHGTRASDEASIGKNQSNGCVRMRDADVRELYDYLVAGKSKVQIAE